MGADPCLPEPLVVRVPAQGTGTVPCRQGRGLVEEEQPGEGPGPHPRPPPAPELQPARDPSAPLPRADQPSLLVVQDPAVAVQKPSGLHRDDVAEWRYAVAVRHGAPPLTQAILAIPTDSGHRCALLERRTRSHV